MANKIKNELAKRKIINLIRQSNRKRNCLIFHSNETYSHKRLKFETFIELQKLGYEIYTEAIFLSGKRCDILGIKEGYAIGIEILSSETDEMLSKKLLNYPKEINWYSIRTLKDLKNLNLL